MLAQTLPKVTMVTESALVSPDLANAKGSNLTAPYPIIVNAMESNSTGTGPNIATHYISPHIANGTSSEEQISSLDAMFLPNVQEQQNFSREGSTQTAALIDENLSLPSANTTPFANTTQMWVVRESSDKQRVPLLSEYVPDPRDHFTDQSGNPWKIVASPWRNISLVVEQISVELWSREKAEASGTVDEQQISRLPFSTRRIRRPNWMAPGGLLEESSEKALNASGPYLVELAENSPFFVQHFMPVFLFVGSLPSSFVARLKELAATVANMGLVTAQVLTSTFMLGLLILFVMIDKGYQQLERRHYENEQHTKEAAWWRQLTSWEAGIPGIEYSEEHPTTFHLQGHQG
jgi:hypothetical protein